MTNSKRPPNAVAPGVESEQDQRAAPQHKILKGLLDVDEEKDNANNTFANKMNVPNQTPQQRIILQQRPVGSESKSDNPIIMHLLNHDDDNNMDGRLNQRNNNSELLRQLQKGDTPKDHHHNMSDISNEELFQKLMFRGNDFPNRKRSSNDPNDDSPLAKRTENDKPQSKLREKNKMLASLLSNPSKAPTSFTTIPVVKTIPDIPLSRLSDSQRGFQVWNV